MVAGPLFRTGWPVNIAQRVLQEVPSFVKSPRARNAAVRNYPSRPRNTGRAHRVFSDGAGAPRACKETTMTKFLAVIAATLLAFAAQAGETKDKPNDPGMQSKATFDALDKNADSQISKTEASADSKLSDNFAALDTNGDGYLSKAEFMARGKSKT
jgi:hypothetical protein